MSNPLRRHAYLLCLVLTALGCRCLPDPAEDGCDSDNDESANTNENRCAGVGGGADNSPLPLSQVRYWAYQIQQVSAPGAVDALASSPYDMLVIEPTRTDWSEDETKNFDTRAVVERLKQSRASDCQHRKLVIAYIDIGEAEDWRWYWDWSTAWRPGTPFPDDWPEFILAVDPDGWTGNYPVAYWRDDWKDIVLHGATHATTAERNFVSILDEVLADGFDGVYLDWVEGFENDAVIARASQDGVDPAAEMIKLIGEIRAYGQQRNPGFLVIQQNAAALLDGRPDLLRAIDAIAQEELWYDGVATDDWCDPDGYDHALDSDDSRELIDLLRPYQDAGVPVFNCEYALNNAESAYRQSYDGGYVPYCTRRSLSKLTTTPPPALQR